MIVIIAQAQGKKTPSRGCDNETRASTNSPDDTSGVIIGLVIVLTVPTSGEDPVLARDLAKQRKLLSDEILPSPTQVEKVFCSLPPVSPQMYSPHWRAYQTYRIVTVNSDACEIGRRVPMRMFLAVGTLTSPTVANAGLRPFSRAKR